MVLDITVNRLALPLLIIICSACNAGTEAITVTDSSVTDSATIENHQLELLQSDDACSLRYKFGDDSKVVEMAPKAPCYFLRRDSDKPQSFPYKDVGVTATLIVMGTPISGEKRVKWNLPQNAVCGEATQGVLIREAEIEVTEKNLTDVVACKDQGVDEKDFWYFSH